MLALHVCTKIHFEIYDTEEQKLTNESLHIQTILTKKFEGGTKKMPIYQG